MIKKYCFEPVDRSLRDVLQSSNPLSMERPFGGKVIVFGGDFRQILPVVSRGTRHDIVGATINSSYLWEHCQVLPLSRNMRLANSCLSADHSELKKFADWILDIGDGNIGDSDEGDATIQIPPYLLLNVINDPISTIVHATYYQLLQNLNNPPYFKERAILASTHVIVDDGFNASVYSSDYLHSICSSGLPNHVLKLKVGVPVMLLRNIDQSSGLCNGTRLMITRLGTRIIEAQIISGRNIGEKVAIPRMVLSPSDSTLPFKFQRRQFSIILSFGMTINKSQGQLYVAFHVGLYLPKPVFTHGQLYVALSTVTSIQGLKVLLLDKYGKSVTETKNVVYKEVLQNI